MTSRVFATLAALALTLVSAACSSNKSNVPVRVTIPATAAAAGSFDTLLAALDAAGLTAALNGPGPFTVFAPTDAAFAALPPGTLSSLLEPANRQQLINILTFHVVPGDVRAADVLGLSSADTLFGQPLDIAVTGGSVRVNGANVTATDILCSNGVIHVIDTVLLPRNIVELAQQTPELSTLVAALGAGGLVDDLSGPGPLTVFAPTNAAFAALPAGTLDTLLDPANQAQLVAILTYHVNSGNNKAADVLAASSLSTLNGASLNVSVSGGQVRINDALVLVTDIIAANGVIHLIDAVLLPST